MAGSSSGAASSKTTSGGGSSGSSAKVALGSAVGGALALALGVYIVREHRKRTRLALKTDAELTPKLLDLQVESLSTFSEFDGGSRGTGGIPREGRVFSNPLIYTEIEMKEFVQCIEADVPVVEHVVYDDSTEMAAMLVDDASLATARRLSSGGATTSYLPCEGGVEEIVASMANASVASLKEAGHAGRAMRVQAADPSLAAAPTPTPMLQAASATASLEATLAAHIRDLRSVRRGSLMQNGGTLAARLKKGNM
jgi:hypothetical protein